MEKCPFTFIILKKWFREIPIMSEKGKKTISREGQLPVAAVASTAT